MKDADYFSRIEPLKEQLYRVAYLYLGSESAAVDAVDEAVYRGYLKRRSLRREAYFSTWLTRILINVCLDELHRRQRETPVEILPERAETPYDALPLQEALERLPEDLRSVIALRYFGGFTLAETARALGLPEGTVSSRQRRALQLLKLHLTDDEEVSPLTAWRNMNCCAAGCPCLRTRWRAAPGACRRASKSAGGCAGGSRSPPAASPRHSPPL